MTITIRVDEAIYNEARKTAKAECRTVAHQIEYWAKIGKAALDNPDLPIKFIRDLLITHAQDRTLAEHLPLKEKMVTIEILQMPAFKRAYKKLHQNQKLSVCYSWLTMNLLLNWKVIN